MVRVAPGAVGFLPLSQVDELPTEQRREAHLASRLPLGRVVQCRVLEVGAGGRRLILTRKKGLLKSSLPPLVSYSTPPSTRAHGYILSQAQGGLIVGFYGGVKVPPSPTPIPLLPH